MKKIYSIAIIFLVFVHYSFGQSKLPQHPALISVFLAEIGDNKIALDGGRPQSASAAVEAELHAIIRTNHQVDYLELVKMFKDQILTGFNISWIPEAEVLSSPKYKAIYSDLTFQHDLANDAPAGYFAIMHFDKKAIRKSFEINNIVDAVAIAFLKYEMKQESRVMDKGKLKIECSGYLSFFDNAGKKTISLNGNAKSNTFTYSYKNGFEQGDLQAYMLDATNKVIEKLKENMLNKSK